MQYYNAPDNRKFSRMIRRDAALICLIVFGSFIIFFLAPFLAYLGQKYNF